MSEELNQNAIYISPSKEIISKFVDGQWHQYIRNDVVSELYTKQKSLNYFVKTEHYSGFSGRMVDHVRVRLSLKDKMNLGGSWFCHINGQYTVVPFREVEYASLSLDAAISAFDMNEIDSYDISWQSSKVNKDYAHL